MSQPQSFPSKKDWWIVLVLWGSAAACIFGGWQILTKVTPSTVGIPIGLAMILSGPFCIWFLYATSYDVTAEKLVARCGPFRTTVEISKITLVEPSRNPLSSPALSLDRLHIHYKGSRFGLLVSPQDRQGFLRALAAANPNLRMEGEILRS